MNIADVIRNIPDFPKPGVQFKDITTLLLHPEAYKYVIDALAERYGKDRPDVIVGVESRGFIFGSTLAYVLGVPFVLARKSGKLPGETIKESFVLEYGTDTIEIHVDAIEPGAKVLIVDDLLATGGTVAAVARLVERMKATVTEAAFVVELPPLKGREKVAPLSVFSMVSFMVE